MSIKTKTVSNTTTSTGLVSAGLWADKNVVVGAFASGYRCVPVVGESGSGHGINVLVLSTDNDQTAVGNVAVTVTVYYL